MVSAPFAAYIAVSACRSRSAALNRGPPIAIPTLARVPTTASARVIGAAIAASTVSATRRARFGAHPGSRTANSSPPSRATTAPSGTQPPIRWPTISSSTSPTSWPNASLTSLNLSRSRSSTTGTSAESESSSSGSAASWASACSIRSVSSTRFGSPVSVSWVASCRNCCSNWAPRSATTMCPARVCTRVRSSRSKVDASPSRSVTISTPPRVAVGSGTIIASRAPRATSHCRMPRSRVCRAITIGSTFSRTRASSQSYDPAAATRSLLKLSSSVIRSRRSVVSSRCRVSCTSPAFSNRRVLPSSVSAQLLHGTGAHPLLDEIVHQGQRLVPPSENQIAPVDQRCGGDEHDDQGDSEPALAEQHGHQHRGRRAQQAEHRQRQQHLGDLGRGQPALMPRNHHQNQATHGQIAQTQHQVTDRRGAQVKLHAGTEQQVQGQPHHRRLEGVRRQVVGGLQDRQPLPAEHQHRAEHPGQHQRPRVEEQHAQQQRHPGQRERVGLATQFDVQQGDLGTQEGQHETAEQDDRWGERRQLQHPARWRGQSRGHPAERQNGRQRAGGDSGESSPPDGHLVPARIGPARSGAPGNRPLDTRPVRQQHCRRGDEGPGTAIAPPDCSDACWLPHISPRLHCVSVDYLSSQECIVAWPAVCPPIGCRCGSRDQRRACCTRSRGSPAFTPE